MIEFLATILIFFICWVIESIKRCRNKFGITSEPPEIRIHSDKPIQLKVEIKGDVEVEIKRA